MIVSDNKSDLDQIKNRYIIIVPNQELSLLHQFVDEDSLTGEQLEGVLVFHAENILKIPTITNVPKLKYYGGFSGAATAAINLVK